MVACACEDLTCLAYMDIDMLLWILRAPKYMTYAGYTQN